MGIILPEGTMDEKSCVSGTTTLTMSLLTAMNGLGHLNEEVQEGELLSQMNRSNFNSKSTLISGTSALLDAQMMVSGISTRQDKDIISAKARAEQEELQAKMVLLTKDPKLWLQFKTRLHALSSGNGIVGIQRAMKDFVSDHPEIEELYMKEKHDVQQPPTDGFGKLRRMTMLQSVRALTSELSRETSIGSTRIFPASCPSHPRNISTESQVSKGLIAARRLPWRSSNEGAMSADAANVSHSTCEVIVEKGSDALKSLSEENASINLEKDRKVQIAKSTPNNARLCSGVVGATTA
jgi:hypothetical protein